VLGDNLSTVQPYPPPCRSILQIATMTPAGLMLEYAHEYYI